MISKVVIGLMVLIVTGFSTHAQAISGTVRDSQTGEPLAFASIQMVETTPGTTTKEQRNFSITVSKL